VVPHVGQDVGIHSMELKGLVLRPLLRWHQPRNPFNGIERYNLSPPRGLVVRNPFNGIERGSILFLTGVRRRWNCESIQWN